MTEENIRGEVERTRTNLEQRLAKGDCYLFSKGSHLTFNQDVARRDLPRIVRILRSDEPEELKFKKLREIGLLGVSKEGFDIVTTFSASPQLEERLEKLQQSGQ